MKEFSYNYIMGGWLSFKGNKSLQHNIDELGKNNYPDENYAREISKKKIVCLFVFLLSIVTSYTSVHLSTIVQLFSVGLYSLNMDGSEILDENGFPKETYTIDGMCLFVYLVDLICHLYVW